MSRVYAHILQAEQLGLCMVQRLVETAPEGSLRDFARLQLDDELRHVAFFSRVASELGVAEQRSPSLALLGRELAGVTGYRSVLVLLQVMENAANAMFNGYTRQSLRMLKRNVRLPGSAAVEALLTAQTQLVGRDEALHVAFGMRVLRSCCAGISVRERHVMEGQVQTASALMASAGAEAIQNYLRLGFDEEEMLKRIAAAQQRYWRHLDIDSEASSSAGAGR
jgi:hypothetical protein